MPRIPPKLNDFQSLMEAIETYRKREGKTVEDMCRILGYGSNATWHSRKKNPHTFTVGELKKIHDNIFIPKEILQREAIL